MSLTPQTVARALGGEARGNQVIAPGPGHSPRDRSLSVTIEPNAPGGLLVHSFAGDDWQAAKDYVLERLALPAFGSQDRPAPIRRPAPTSGARRYEREYIYRDERGDPYLKVARTRDKAFPQFHWKAGDWVKGAPPGRRIPYRLPELLAAPDAPVWIVEGEKDADNLAALGLVATCNPMGAEVGWTPSNKPDDLSPWFAGRDVAIIPDNDEVGRKHARNVAAHLMGLAASVRIVDLPDLQPKGDVSDWLDAGGDRASLEALRASARRVTHDDLAKAPEKAGKDAKTVTPWQSRGMDAATLWRAEFPPVRYLIEGVLPEGLTLLAGKPKLGKSWLTLDMALAVATGGNVLGKATEAGDVLFLALEDNKRRLQARMKRLFGHFNPPDLSRMLVATDWAKAGDGCVEDIRSWSESVAAPRLVVIDTLGCIRGAADGKQSAYQDDVAALRPLHALANEKGFAIVVVHHVRKMEAEDPLDQVSGTTGLAGTADTILVLDRRADTGLTLRGRGRDLENEIDLAMNFDRETCRFSIRGDANEVKRSTERSLILSALKGAPDGMSPQEVAAETGMNRSNVKVLLPKMVKAGEAMKAKGRGCYLHPDFADRPDPEITDYLGYPVTNGLGDSGEAGGEDGEPRDYGDSW